MDLVEICNVYVGKMIITAAKRIFNSDKICRSYSDLNFGVTFFLNTVYIRYLVCVILLPVFLKTLTAFKVFLMHTCTLVTVYISNS